MADLNLQLEPWFVCDHCGDFSVINCQYFYGFFQKQKQICHHCTEELDWWKVIRKIISDNFMSNAALAALGCRTNLINISLKANTIAHIELKDYGIPTDAKVLDVTYTPQAIGLFPIEVHGNRPDRHFISNTLRLYPMPLGVPGPDSVPLAILVCWVPHSPDDAAWNSLVEAFHAYCLGRYEALVIPANIAVESKISRLLAKHLTGVASKEIIESFLQNAATYSHQLNLLIPLMMKPEGINTLPDAIRGQLNKLRGFRNDISHRGKPDSFIDQKVAAELLCAALFGFHYVDYVSSTLTAKYNSK